MAMLTKWSGFGGNSPAPLRIGTTSVIAATTEQVSILYSPTTSALNTALVSRMYVSTNTVMASSQIANRMQLYRQVTDDTTDTARAFPLEITCTINALAAKTYTNSNASPGVGGILINALARDSSTGSVAITNYGAINCLADSSAVTGRKAYVRLGALSGGTLGQASITDNNTFGGAGESYFIHSTGTNSSLFSGVVNCSAGLRTKVALDNVSNPPTQAEMVTAFGAAATTGAGFIGIINDNNGGTAEYLCWSDGTNYFYAAGTVGA